MKSARLHLATASLALAVLYHHPARADAANGVKVPPVDSELSPAYDRLVIANVMLIDGSGAPMQGPVDVTISGAKIASITNAHGKPAAAAAPTQPGMRLIDGTGKFMMPGLIDAHTHFRGMPKEYVYRLFLANGVTSIRNLDGSLTDAGKDVPEAIMTEKHAIEAGREIAPRLKVYPFLPPDIQDANQVPSLVKRWHAMGVDGIKLVYAQAEYPEMVAALGKETQRYGMGLAVHITETATPAINALTVARDGASSIEHHYGYAETALVDDLTIPRLPSGYNYGDERARFRETLGIWQQADIARLKEKTLPELVTESVKGRFTMVPTMVVYEKQRDYTRASNVPWLAAYALPSALKLWSTPDPTRHGAIFDKWTSNDEASAAISYRRWMEFIRSYVAAGGHLAVGADSGGPFQVFGFQTIREMELLLEAGLTPLEVVRAATQEGARAIQQPNTGTIRPGYAADFLLVDENPLENFKVLMPRATARADKDGAPRHSAIRYVAVNGRLVDPEQMLRDVEAIVQQDRAGELHYNLW